MIDRVLTPSMSNFAYLEYTIIFTDVSKVVFRAKIKYWIQPFILAGEQHLETSPPQVLHSYKPFRVIQDQFKLLVLLVESIQSMSK